MRRTVGPPAPGSGRSRSATGTHLHLHSQNALVIALAIQPTTSAAHTIPHRAPTLPDEAHKCNCLYRDRRGDPRLRLGVHVLVNPASRVKAAVRGVDTFQQRRAWIAFPYAVFRKFGEDQAGNLAALIAYYGFFSVFPLLLVLVTVLGMVLHGHPGLQARVLSSALAQFPVLGTQIQRNIGSLRGGGLALVIGVALTLWSGLGVVKATETAMNGIWNVPFRKRPNFMFSTLRALLMLAVLGAITLAAAIAGSVGAGSGAWLKVIAGTTHLWSTTLGTRASEMTWAALLSANRVRPPSTRTSQVSCVVSLAVERSAATVTESIRIDGRKTSSWLGPGQLAVWRSSCARAAPV